jgi:hypothetical protein
MKRSELKQLILESIQELKEESVKPADIKAAKDAFNKFIKAVEAGPGSGAAFEKKALDKACEKLIQK